MKARINAVLNNQNWAACRLMIRSFMLGALLVLAVGGLLLSGRSSSAAEPPTVASDSQTAGTDETDQSRSNGARAEEPESEDTQPADGRDNDQDDEPSLEPIELSTAEWRRRLTRAQFAVLRKHETERAFRNKYWDNKQEGVYHCAGCQLPLFDSETKYDSKTGWPSFYAPISNKYIGTMRDRTFFQVRTEVHCIRCGGHLGHVFSDGPRPTGLRFCINSAALKFKDRAKD